MSEDMSLYWQCTFGGKSHMNLLGKIVLAPFIIYLGLLFTILDILFTKKNNNIKRG